MKHLPNLLTLGNLFFGCMAIVYIMNSQHFLPDFQGGEQYWVYDMEQAHIGSLFILLAALCDLLDGAVARALKVYSPIGKDLDSLADVVTFGVAPSMIMYKLLWATCMSNLNAFDTNMLAMAPAFLIACFAALRLAKFNITAAEQSHSFKGMPTPAVGLFVACLPLLSWYNPYNLGNLLQNRWLLYGIIALLCWLMVSGIRFIKLMPTQWNLKAIWPQLILVVVAAVGAPLLKVAVLPLLFILYIIVSFIYKEPAVATAK